MSDTRSDQNILPGPAALFLCGFDPAAACSPLQNLIAGMDYPALRLIFCTREMLDALLADALSETFLKGTLLAANQLPAVCLLSGLPPAFLHTFLSRFHETGLVRPIFATTTTSNLAFTVKELLRHLLEERRQQQDQNREK